MKVNSNFFASNSILDIEVLRNGFLFSDCGSQKKKKKKNKKNLALKICQMYKLRNNFHYIRL